MNNNFFYIYFHFLNKMNLKMIIKIGDKEVEDGGSGDCVLFFNI